MFELISQLVRPDSSKGDASISPNQFSCASVNITAYGSPDKDLITLLEGANIAAEELIFVHDARQAEWIYEIDAEEFKQSSKASKEAPPVLAGGDVVDIT